MFYKSMDMIYIVMLISLAEFTRSQETIDAWGGDEHSPIGAPACLCPPPQSWTTSAAYKSLLSVIDDLRYAVRECQVNKWTVNKLTEENHSQNKQLTEIESSIHELENEIHVIHLRLRAVERRRSREGRRRRRRVKRDKLETRVGDLERSVRKIYSVIRKDFTQGHHYKRIV